MSDKNNNLEWKKFCSLRDELLDLIAGGTEELDNSSTDSLRNSIRVIRYTEDKELFYTLQKLSKKMNAQYKKATKEKRNYPRVPVFLENVENIIINSYDAFASVAVEENSMAAEIGTLRIHSLEFLKEYWGKDYQQNVEKYNLIEDEKRNSIFMGYDDILKMANIKKMQIRKQTGKRYVLNVRKIGENISTRYKYGIVILDRNPIIHHANKEAKRRHCLALNGERVKFPFPTDFLCDLFVKD